MSKSQTLKKAVVYCSKVTPICALFIVLSIVSLDVLSSEEIKIGKGVVEIYDWNERDGSVNSAFTGYVEDLGKSDDYDHVYIAVVDFSIEGKKRIYFTIESKGESSSTSICEYSSSEIPDKATWTFSLDGGREQGVRMLVFCKKYTDSNRTYMSASAMTDKGSNYIKDLFTKSSNMILISSSSATNFPISPMGFVAVWNSFGSDAY